MKIISKKTAALLSCAAVLFTSGCENAASKSNSALNTLTSKDAGESTAQSSSSASNTQSTVSSSAIQSSSSNGIGSTSIVSSAEPLRPIEITPDVSSEVPPDVSSDVPPDVSGEPEPPVSSADPLPPTPSEPEITVPPSFNVTPRDPLPLPESAEVRICSLSEALERWDEIAAKTPEGSPEEIIQTLMERDILCFSLLQAKSWTISEKDEVDFKYSRGSGRVYCNYIMSTSQIDDLFYGTYTKDKTDYFIHYFNGWSYFDMFSEQNGNIYADFSQVLKAAPDSFETPTYVSILSASSDEIVFGRYSSPTPDSAQHQPNNYHFTAVKENGKWRLEEYIIDAPAYEQPYENLIQTGRLGAPDIVELAKGEAGNFGGYRYWSWCGYSTRIEWCAAFVSWCYGQVGLDGPNFVSCNSQGIPWFKQRGLWVSRSYRDIAPGDSIFFDWDLDGEANHVGLVIGTDGEKVYTIEGNRSDTCQVFSYDLDDDRIFGYGLMKYN